MENSDNQDKMILVQEHSQDSPQDSHRPLKPTQVSPTRNSSRIQRLNTLQQTDSLIEMSETNRLINLMGTREQIEFVKGGNQMHLQHKSRSFNEMFPNYQKAVLGENLPIFQLVLKVVGIGLVTLFIYTAIAYNLQLIDQLIVGDFFIIFMHYLTRYAVKQSDYYYTFAKKFKREVKKFVKSNPDLDKFMGNYNQSLIGFIQTADMELERLLIDRSMFKLKFFIPPSETQLKKLMNIRKHILLTDLFMEAIITKKNPTKEDISQLTQKLEICEGHEFEGIEIELLMKTEAYESKQNPYMQWVYKFAIVGKLIACLVFYYSYAKETIQLIYYPYLFYALFQLERIFRYLDKPLAFFPEKIRSLNYSVNSLIPNLGVEVDQDVKILPTINFFHSDSISTSGNIRQLLHGNGQWFIHQTEFVYISYIFYTIIEIIIGVFHYSEQYVSKQMTDQDQPNEDDQLINPMQVFLGQIVLFQILPIVIAVLYFFFLAAETNENFQNYNQALNELRLIVEELYMYRQDYFGENGRTPAEPLYQICVKELKESNNDSFEQIEKNIVEVQNRLGYELYEIEQLGKNDQQKIFGIPITKAQVYTVISLLGSQLILSIFSKISEILGYGSE